MDDSSAHYRGHGRRERTAGAAATVLVYVALLGAVLLVRSPPPTIIADPVLRTFDVRLPPPPPPPPQPPPEAVSRPVKRVPPIAKSRPITDPGGAASPAAAAPKPIEPRAGVIEVPDITAVPDAIPLPSIAASSGWNGDTGAGPSSGAGQGRGDGDGTGDGNDAGVIRYQRAEWIVRPTSAAMRPYWPLEAIRQRLNGQAVLACTLYRSGQPRRCRILAEQPKNAGFGAAALRMSPTFRIRPVLRNKAPLDIPVIVPIVFDQK